MCITIFYRGEGNINILAIKVLNRIDSIFLKLFFLKVAVDCDQLPNHNVEWYQPDVHEISITTSQLLFTT